MGRFIGVTAVEDADNIKLGDMHTTWQSQATCPPLCPWLKEVPVINCKGEEMMMPACYGNKGQARWTTNRLNRQATEHRMTPEELAREHARAVHTLSGKKHTRVNVVGDSGTDEATRMLSDAIREVYKRAYRFGFRETPETDCHAYTHFWKTVSRRAWQDISVLASTESFKDVRKAMKRGYAASIVLPEQHKSPKAYKVDNMTVIPCPQQTGASPTCMDCQLCFKDKWLLKTRRVIAFEPDKGTDSAVKESLIQIQTGGN